MKKFLSLILTAVIMCFSLTAVATAETAEKSFPMAFSTGIINYTSNSVGMSANIVPTLPSEDSIIIKTNALAPEITKVALVVEGQKYGRNYAEKAEYNFTNYYDLECKQEAQYGGQYWKLGLFADTTYIGNFLVTVFDKIYGIDLIVEGYEETIDEQYYYSWGINKTLTINPVFTIVKPFNNDVDITNAISQIVTSFKEFKYVSKEIHYDYPFLMNTDYNNDGIITRDEVACLSYSSLGEGKGIPGFEGLASQVASFFNKKTNGKIIFKVTTAPTTIATTWNNGGVPISSTGIFTAPTTTINDNIIGLFFNYESTGSLVALSKIESDGTITFDISKVLDDVSGNTLSTFRSIYYGLIGGIGYTNYPVKGIKIEQVILSYEEDEEVDTTIIVDDPVVETEVEVVIEPEKEVTTETTTEAITTVEEVEVEIELSDDTVVVSDTTTEVITNAGNVVVEEDSNPHTGAALVVVPTIVAGAIVLVSKKRK
jgi:hypothetical protein